MMLLATLEHRDLAAAGELLAPGIAMTFPGPARFTDLQSMVAGAAGRYQRIGKVIESVEGFVAGEGREVVYVRGTLHGVNLHGVGFEGVRFIDRFEVVDGLIERQDVWNDLAESGVLARRS